MSVSTISLASSWPLANEHQAQPYQSLAHLSPSLFILIIMEEEKKTSGVVQYTLNILNPF